MSTRAIIAKPAPGDDIQGVYHHFDGYPGGLGADLFRLVSAFNGNVEALCKVLIDDHVNGWSSIGGWDGKPENVISYDEKERRHKSVTIGEFTKRFELARGTTANCAIYYDGERANENAQFFTLSDLAESWAEYLYVLRADENQMSIYSLPHGKGMHYLATVPLDGNEPDWSSIEEGAFDG